MTFKVPPIEIPEDDPFRFDVLDRKPSIEALHSLINEAVPPFVLAIDSPWGTGKTTYVRLLQNTLVKDDYTCLYFNAWTTDLSADPLLIGRAHV